MSHLLVPQDELGNEGKQSWSKLMKYVLVSTGKLPKSVKGVFGCQGALGAGVIQFQLVNLGCIWQYRLKSTQFSHSEE